MKHFGVLAATVILSICNNAMAKSPQPNQVSDRDQTREEQLMVELTGQETKKISDTLLYSEIASAYQKGNQWAFRNHAQNFMKQFPKSSYVDSVLYLAGLLAVDNKNFPEAIRYFSQVEKEYPFSDKVTAATFAKAMTFKKLNLEEFARRLLKDIRTKYPGSPESFRAEAELKMIK